VHGLQCFLRTLLLSCDGSNYYPVKVYSPRVFFNNGSLFWINGTLLNAVPVIEIWSQTPLPIVLKWKETLSLGPGLLPKSRYPRRLSFRKAPSTLFMAVAPWIFPTNLLASHHFPMPHWSLAPFFVFRRAYFFTMPSFPFRWCALAPPPLSIRNASCGLSRKAASLFSRPGSPLKEECPPTKVEEFVPRKCFPEGKRSERKRPIPFTFGISLFGPFHMKDKTCRSLLPIFVVPFPRVRRSAPPLWM